MNNAPWQRIPREYSDRLPAEIEAKFVELAAEFNRSKGMRCYEIGGDLGYLSNVYYAKTGKWLKKPKKEKAQ